MDLLGSLLTFGLGAATIIVSQSVQAWRELRLDQSKRSNDRRIDRGRTEARTLADLQVGLADLRLAMGLLHRAMDTDPSPRAELDEYTRARAQVDLQSNRVLAPGVLDASRKTSVLASLAASTDDGPARSDLLAGCFQAIDEAEALVGPALREQIAGGYLKLVE
jgi:hypothetical protein